jgi:hypothetical protein
MQFHAPSVRRKKTLNNRARALRVKMRVCTMRAMMPMHTRPKEFIKEQVM